MPWNVVPPPPSSMYKVGGVPINELHPVQQYFRSEDPASDLIPSAAAIYTNTISGNVFFRAVGGDWAPLG